MSDSRYTQYPALARRARAMSEEELRAVQQWHAELVRGLTMFAAKYPVEARLLGDNVSERMAARRAIDAFLAVMTQVIDVLRDPSEKDWCCKHGMNAHPLPCPQHAWSPDRDYPYGTIIERPAEGRVSRAIRVNEGLGEFSWQSIEQGYEYRECDLVEGGWVVVGHA